jgi:glycosyltransferase involved in cell wall biosynthesis
VAALRQARRAGKPVLLVQHIAAIPFRSAVLRAAMSLANRLVAEPMLAAADQVVFISETTAQHFRTAKFRRPPLVVFNGVDTGLFRPAESSEKASAREGFGLPAVGPVALFVGRFVEKKGLSVLKAIAAQRQDVTFAFAGRGPIDPSGWGLANVRVFEDLPRERLAELYRAASALVLPSVGEGYPLVIQEALASDLAVLCGEESALADLAALPVLRGLPVDLADPASTASAFARGLDAVLAEASDGRRVTLARERYAWAAVARRYEAALRELAGAPQRS